MEHRRSGHAARIPRGAAAQARRQASHQPLRRRGAAELLLTTTASQLSLAAPHPSHTTMPQLPPRPAARKAGAPGGTLFSSTANLANTLIGSGALATPGAFRHTGLIPGAALICWCAATSAAGLLLLVACARTVGGRQQSFGSLAQRAIPRAARLFNLAIALKCYGVSIR